jgi:hypothetical protein
MSGIGRVLQIAGADQANRIVDGFQLRSSTLRIDCAANFGAAATTRPSWLSTVGAVERDEVDLVPGNATLFVEHLEERRVQLVDRAVGGGAAAVRHWCCRS